MLFSALGCSVVSVYRVYRVWFVKIPENSIVVGALS